MTDLVDNVNRVLKVRRVSVETLSERTKIGLAALQAFLAGSGELSNQDVKKISKALSVPLHALFMEELDGLHSLPDFRRVSPAKVELDLGTQNALAVAEHVSAMATEVEFGLDSPSVEKYRGPLTRPAAIKLAKKWRKRWGMSNLQQADLGSPPKLYKSLRSFVEDLGIFVLHESLGNFDVSGFYTHTSGGAHVIVINTYKNLVERRTFTLAHELCHVLLGKVGVSKLFKTVNSVERFCNWFAVELLASRAVVEAVLRRWGYRPSLDNSVIRIIAEKIGISQQATVLRLMDLGYLGEGAYGTWMSQFSGDFPDVEVRTGGGGAPDPIQSKVSRYGKNYVKLLRYAHDTEVFDEIDVYQVSGVKPKYQSALFGAV